MPAREVHIAVFSLRLFVIFSGLFVNAFCTAAPAVLRGNGTFSLYADQKVQISLKFGKRNVCLNGAGESLVLEHLVSNLNQDFDWKTPSDAVMHLRHSTRILRSETTFAEVVNPILKSYTYVSFQTSSL